MCKYEWNHYDLDSLPLDSIDRHTFSFIKPHSYVLELGCATGFHTQHLKEKLQCKVVAVELDRQAAQKAKKYTEKIIIGNLDHQKTWHAISQYKPFDTIIASNIIEHLIDPWSALKQMHTLLKSKGGLVVAVPNIAFWRARIKLLKGIWQYEDIGIFDRTHTKFFTVTTIQQAIIDAGFQIKEVKYDPAGGAKWFTPLLKKFPNAYAHQIAVHAIKT